MRLITRTLKVLPLAAIVAGAMASPAAAEVSISCTFDGLTGSLTPAIPAPGVAGVGATGTYTFNGDASCSGTYNGTPVVQQPAVITANGTYTNLVCGTGLAPGNSRITFPGSSLPGANAAYQLAFVLGNSPIAITNFTADDGQTGRGGGAVHIQAANQLGCVTEPVQQFVVTGAFAAAGA